MSVRKGDRKVGELQVLNKARELKEYSLGILRNQKYFPKSTRWLYANPIANEVRNACDGRVERGTARESLNSWLANASRGNTYWKRCKMVDYYKEKKNEYCKNRT